MQRDGVWLQGSRTARCFAASSSSDHYWDFWVCISSGAEMAMKGELEY